MKFFAPLVHLPRIGFRWLSTLYTERTEMPASLQFDFIKKDKCASGAKVGNGMEESAKPRMPGLISGSKHPAKITALGYICRFRRTLQNIEELKKCLHLQFTIQSNLPSCRASS